MAGDDDRNPRVGWRHEWGTLALLWAMVVWVSVTILGTRGSAASYVTVADVVVVAFVLAGGVLATLTIVRAAQIPMLSAPVAVPAEADAESGDDDDSDGGSDVTTGAAASGTAADEADDEADDEAADEAVDEAVDEAAAADTDDGAADDEHPDA